ncbi:MAG: Tetratricopeptide TPR_2 repeat protein [Candidatus Beckwithbacteria bacterium GW2011_GWA2_43_10]|uniref:Tetratricopeptide TPR_2 repeat protein n=1 Tax=Candidatus Beckwithbacteria bacterium GW2011_GWA2_43_10 TaxID=1618369 RepID=A0A0G1E6K3_9BACT|nr:MAG: Tetratricopeptide TPR_2 repeat protein [Candidatus Beckwithbacteria bacterium GW2011_GWA2_43_10]
MTTKISQTKVINNLRRTLDKLGLIGKVSADDILSVIYHSADPKVFQEIINVLGRYTKTEKDLQLLTESIQAAWNHSPHKTLKNLSPDEKLAEYHQGVKTKPRLKPKYRSNKTSVCQLAETDLPNECMIKKMGNKTWGMELPASFFKAKDKLLKIKPWTLPVKEAKGKLEELLKQEPFCQLAILSLKRAYLDQGKEKQARELMETAIGMFKNLLPGKFQPGVDRFPWAILNNRDFLTLILDYAFFIEFFNGVKASIPHFEYVLELNPNDNQGARTVLATAYLKTNQLNKMLALAEKYAEDINQEILLGKALCLYKLGKKNQAEKWLRKNYQWVKHSIRELLKTDHKKVNDEAYLYWFNQGSLWQAAPGAIDWLAGIKKADF